MDDNIDDGVAASPAEQAAQIRSLQQQLCSLQHEHEQYRNHYQELESVCWELLGDMKQLCDEEELHGLPPRRRFVERALRTRLQTPALETVIEEAPFKATAVTEAALSPSLVSRQDQLASPPPPPSPAAAPPRVCGPLYLDRADAQALVDRLRTLRQWMGDLHGGIQALTSRRIPTSSSLARHQDSPLACPIDAAVLAKAADLKSTAKPAHTSPAGGETMRLLHRVLDDLFLQFTQLQATLTDTLWTTAHPPALSTPAHTQRDHDVEVTRLRAINQQLRRTLRGYEQSNRKATDSSRAQRLSSPSPSRKTTSRALRIPPGYAKSQEEGLVVAVPRRQ
ncbi:hypothetical protein N2W54_004983 [Lotmaria passim]